MYYLSKFDDYEALAADIETFICFYNFERRQKHIDKLATMPCRQLLKSVA